VGGQRRLNAGPLGGWRLVTLRFDDWYYGGPYLPVGNPDTDLPRRDSSIPVTEDCRARIEFDGKIGGERFIAPFHDENSVGEIHGTLLVAASYPNGWSEDERYRFPTIQGLLAEAALRIETKLRRKPTRRRAAAFRAALELVRSAAARFATGEYEAAQRDVWQAHTVMEREKGGKRRKTAFIVDTEGNVSNT
jgi:hypothetical protein